MSLVLIIDAGNTWPGATGRSLEGAGDCSGEVVYRDVEKPRLEFESLFLGRFSAVPGPGAIDARDSRQC